MTPVPDETPPSKRLLICPDCGHESPVDGDWIVRENSRLIYDCPVCERTLTVRPPPGAGADRD